ncbi:Biotin-requiring enzyme [Neomoorella glycerini]|uniref:Biotin-requiring enzyme n=1 Tax=Neomoorella glycerini TaxID=55779 RepID=A0A6I5ZQ16_9FIRM|nr:biotin/lipoyl-containing protein [Moorella glycerini]QGP91621.1 Biotin-requiring enzyme [Moorella glycerini]
MKTYIIHVNGQRYEVTVEEKSSGTGIPGVIAVLAPALSSPPASPVAPTPVTPPPAQGPAGANTITAPMPGKVVAVKVKMGTPVKQGDVLIVLEAMKMENEIVAPGAGTVKEIYVSEGASVNVGEPLVAII